MNISLILAGALAAFLIFNFKPASIFMGDSGSLVIGYVLAVLGIVGAGAPAFNPFAVYAVPVMIFLVPILDTTLVTLIIGRALYDILVVSFGSKVQLSMASSDAWDFVGDGTLLGLSIPVLAALALALHKERRALHRLALAQLEDLLIEGPIAIQRRHVGQAQVTPLDRRQSADRDHAESHRAGGLARGLLIEEPHSEHLRLQP